MEAGDNREREREREMLIREEKKKGEIRSCGALSHLTYKTEHYLEGTPTEWVSDSAIGDRANLGLQLVRLSDKMCSVPTLLLRRVR